jgi:hypothetical protein
VVGAIRWFAASVVSGTFEPYDSGVGLLLNQIILSVPTVVLAWPGDIESSCHSCSWPAHIRA